jgi:hypothetical protein
MHHLQVGPNRLQALTGRATVAPSSVATRDPSVVPEADAVQVPQVLAPVAVAAPMRGEEDVDDVVVEKLAFAQRRVMDGPARMPAEVATQPFGHRSAESLLRAVEDLAREQVAHGSAERMLALP